MIDEIKQVWWLFQVWFSFFDLYILQRACKGNLTGNISLFPKWRIFNLQNHRQTIRQCLYSNLSTFYKIRQEGKVTQKVTNVVMVIRNYFDFG